MSNETLNEKSLVNIVRVEIVTEETTPKTYRFDTADEATYSAVVSAGAENILRVKNKILAINKTEDIQYGSDLNMKQVTMVPEVLAIVDGGTLVYDEDDETKVVEYNPPVLGAVVNRTKFTLNVYTEEKETEGITLGYQCFSFPGCKGKPVSFTFKDGEFMTPQYTIASRVPRGESPYGLEFLETLPS